MGRVLMELMKAREEYNRLLEMERTADPEYVDVIAYQIKAQEKRLELLRKELELDIKYTIQYEHLQDNLVKDARTKWCFNYVKDCANEYGLELSDEDFKRFLELQIADKDIRWIMHKMSIYNKSLTDALISYITY